MSRLSSLPLQSWELDRFTAPVWCFLCGSSNALDADRCRACQAPLALFQGHEETDQELQIIALLGPGGVGKSVYLGLLTDMLSRPASQLQIMLRGAYSVAMLQTTITALAQGRFPERATDNPQTWNWIRCQLYDSEGSSRRELLLPDLAGDWLEQQLDRPAGSATLTSILERAAGAFIFIDAGRAVRGDPEGEYFARKSIACLQDLARTADSGNAPAIGFLLSKADEADEALDCPQAFARQFLPGLVQLCNHEGLTHQFFGVSVTPVCAWSWQGAIRHPVPLRIEPRGLWEPFEWLLRQMPRRPAKRRRWWPLS